MKRITTGIENFKEIIDNNYYYVDKTKLIKNLLDEKLVLFTRPRRFGKTLNMSMLYYFFSNKENDNAYLFDGLNISKYEDMLRYQNQYPVLFLSLKDMGTSNYASALNKFKSIISRQIAKYPELLVYDTFDSRLFEVIKNLYNEIASEDEYTYSLLYLSEALEIIFKKKTIILIDEYDVPLQAAYNNGYYEEMVEFIRAVFSNGLKTNNSLYKGVMTGCLRIAKESIFTGLNNFNVYAISDHYNSEYFGFTNDDMKKILDYYHLSSHYNDVREWYDGYLFGKTEIYNPWSVLKYVDKYLKEKSKPESFWANTSGNDIVYKYINEGNEVMRQDFEMLVNGHSITKKIYPELTYREMDDIENIYSFLLFTGYLRIKENLGNDLYSLVIPNKEVKKIYENHFYKFFEDYTKNIQKEFVESLKNEDIERANDILNDILEQSVSFYDNYENFYHGFLIGLLSGYRVKSNHESGSGRFDIAILSMNPFKRSIVIECKKSNRMKDMLEDSIKASHQIIDKKYIEGLQNEGYQDVVGYGISFYQKSCYITKANKEA